jgi:hypothetical protein
MDMKKLWGPHPEKNGTILLENGTNGSKCMIKCDRVDVISGNQMVTGTIHKTDLLLVFLRERQSSDELKRKTNTPKYGY